MVPLLASLHRHGAQMTTKTTFQQLLNDYLFVGPQKPRYWQDYKDRMWLEHGIRIRAGDGTRERVLDEYRKERKRAGERLMKEELTRRDFIMGLIEKDDSWTGGNLIVPFKAKQQPEGTRFPEAPNAPISDTYQLTHTQIVVKKHIYWKFGPGARASKAVMKAMDDFVSDMKDKIAENMLRLFK